MTRPLFIAAAAMFSLFAAPAAAAEDSPRPVVLQAEVAAPVADVWRALTTADGVRTFFASAAQVETRLGGAYEMYFLLDQRPGLRGGEGNRVLALEAPYRLMVSWNAPADFGALRDQRTVVEFLLTPQPNDRTLVTTIHGGWGRGADWARVREYFAEAWRIVLGRLQYRFDHGPVEWSAPPAPDYFRPAP